MAPTLKNSRKSLSTKCQSPGTTDKENAFLHSVSEFHSRIRRRESIRLKYKVSEPIYIFEFLRSSCLRNNNISILKKRSVISNRSHEINWQTFFVWRSSGELTFQCLKKSLLFNGFTIDCFLFFRKRLFLSEIVFSLF